MDMVLLSGDLFHDNKPSRTLLHVVSNLFCLLLHLFMTICPSDGGLYVLGWALLGGGVGMGVIGHDDSTKCCHRARINIIINDKVSPPRNIRR